MIDYCIGDKIKSYTIKSICGSGAFGTVYMVSDILGNRVALKLLSGTVHSGLELQALIRYHSCRHPNLLTVFHIDRLEDGRYFYTMELADAFSETETYSPDTLQARLEKRGKIPPFETERIIRELLSGLSLLHRSHLLHRDIKPGNILFVKKRALLADIGLVTGKQGASIRGTPGFLPPDLLTTGRAMSEADDLYALGKLLYCMLTGEAPERFPSTPETLQTAQEKKLMAIAEAACSGQVSSTQKFLELLDSGIVLQKKRFLKKIIPLMIFPAAVAGIVLLIKFYLDSSGKTFNTVQIKPESPQKLHPQIQILLDKYRLSSAEETKLAALLEIRKKIIEQWQNEFDNAGDAKELTYLISTPGQQRRRQIEYNNALPGNNGKAVFWQLVINNLCNRVGENIPAEFELANLESALKFRNLALQSK